MNLLEFQLKMLEKELDFINDISARMDGITQTTKNWAVVTWAGSIAVILGKNELWKYLPLTGVLPLLFYYIDAQWRYLQSRSMFRANKIHEFLNDDRLEKSIIEERLINFKIYDPAAKSYKNDLEYNEYVNFRKAINLSEVAWFYLPMSILSTMLGVILYLKIF